MRIWDFKTRAKTHRLAGWHREVFAAHIDKTTPHLINAHNAPRIAHQGQQRYSLPYSVDAHEASENMRPPHGGTQTISGVSAS